MNGTGFGFPSYPQRPSVKPQQVGMALQQMHAAPPMPAPAPSPETPGYLGPPRFAAPSATPPQAGDPDPDPAVKMAVHEAMDRMASGGDSRGQQGDGSPNNPEQLRRMGLSPLEIKLLWMSGGARY